MIGCFLLIQNLSAQECGGGAQFPKFHKNILHNVLRLLQVATFIINVSGHRRIMGTKNSIVDFLLTNGWFFLCHVLIRAKLFYTAQK